MSRTRVLLALAMAMAPGCGSSHPTSPLAPSTAASPVQVQQQSLAGYVGDTAFRSVAGARVEVLDGPQAGMSITSDGNGLFSYAGTFASAVTLRASKDGYIALTQTTQTSVSGGRPWIYFQLEMIAPPVDIAGDYTLTFIADSTCASIPSELRTRSYAATIAPVSNPLTRLDTSFTLTAGGSPFLENYNNFPIGVAGDYAAVMVYNGEDFGLVERIGSGTYLAFSGEGRTSLGASPLSTISVAFDGAIDYCVLKSDAGWFDACTSSQAVAHQECRSKNHRLVLTRR
jgi:hypothetical protein